eukprot:352422-Chlamydomonas_euryale.AAC.4
MPGRACSCSPEEQALWGLTQVGPPERIIRHVDPDDQKRDTLPNRHKHCSGPLPSASTSLYSSHQSSW